MADAAGELARQLIRSGEYGGDVDPEEVRAAAAASGDAGLMAQVEFGLAHGFDVTPADLIDAIVTEKGVVERPNAAKMTELMNRKRLH